MANGSDDIILRVKDLRISFRTVSGKVQAVRNISFDLRRGETLAIVGESGSGKSVTNRAIMGILAKNGTIESGQILYDGKDLTKITEREYCRIRGDKIAMIFQDPLSSLNPIIRIGRQITEATLLKSRANRKDAKRNLRFYNKRLSEEFGRIYKDDPESLSKAEALLDDYKKAQSAFIKLDRRYNHARSEAQNASDDLADIIFNLEHNVAFDCPGSVRAFLAFFRHACHEYVIPDKEKINGISREIREAIRKAPGKKGHKDYKGALQPLHEAEALLSEALAKPVPDLLAYCYHALVKGGSFEEGLSIDEKNDIAVGELVQECIKPLEGGIEKALKNSHLASKKAMSEAIEAINEKRHAFTDEPLHKPELMKEAKELAPKIKATIDTLALTKDSYTYTYSISIKDAINRYFDALKNNAKESKRFAKRQAKYDKKVAKGKTPGWKPVPPNILPVDHFKSNIVGVLDNLVEIYGETVDHDRFDEKEIGPKVLPYLKEQASLSVSRVTKGMAKNMAIKLMKEVGISEPRRRFRQYPFEFSGGMRQRIVIAIALAANPEILICDEPTTALDVTIQAQILELINKIKAERNLSVIFITHNLGVVANMADSIAVMYAGKIVEYGRADDIFYDPRHPYTWALLSSMPDLETEEKLEAIPGTPPNMIYPPKGDAFAPRNKYALKIDFRKEPPMFEITPTHSRPPGSATRGRPRSRGPRSWTRGSTRCGRATAKRSTPSSKSSRRKSPTRLIATQPCR